MGGGSEHQHLLCVLPFPEPKGVIERIKNKHPRLKVTYIHPDTEKVFDNEQGISDGSWRIILPL
jgi:hypothetical protein